MMIVEDVLEALVDIEERAIAYLATRLRPCLQVDKLPQIRDGVAKPHNVNVVGPIDITLHQGTGD